MNDKDKEAFKEWGKDQDGDEPLCAGGAYEAWQAACKYKQKEIDELINASKLEFDKWYIDGMRKSFFEEKRAYDLYYNYTKDVCTYRNLAAVKEKNDALNLANSYKLLLEKLQVENAKLRECIEFYAQPWERGELDGELLVRKSGSYDLFTEVHYKARQVLKELENNKGEI